MASRRQSLKALAEERGLFAFLWWAGCGSQRVWTAIVGTSLVAEPRALVEAPTRRACEAGLRACLESMPLKRKGRG